MMHQASTLDSGGSVSTLLSKKRGYHKELKTLAERHRYVVIYGCGAIQRSILQAWNRYVGREIDFCCDTASAKWGRLFCNVRCLSPLELKAIQDECIIFITIEDGEFLCRQLAGDGFSEVHCLSLAGLRVSGLLSRHENEELLLKLSDLRDTLKTNLDREAFDTILVQQLSGGNDCDFLFDLCTVQPSPSLGLVELFENLHLEQWTLSRRIGMDQSAYRSPRIERHPC